MNHFRSSIETSVLIREERYLWIIGIFREATRDHACILDRHVHALAKIRHHRVTCITEQRNAPCAPLLQRLAHEQAPFVEQVDILDHVENVGMSVREILEAIFRRSLLRPRFKLPTVVFDLTRERHQLGILPAHRIGGDMRQGPTQVETTGAR